jgi:CheY-like chemotaxis protein/GGDEF domain-containing protein
LMADSQPTILIVDDDSDDLTAVERALASLGSKVVSVRDPHDVLPSVRRHHPDVVILDALLPGLSGFDLCRQIKTNSELKGTQIIILTGVYLRQQYRSEALQQFKADGFVTKPFRASELQRLVVQLLAKKTRKPQAGFLRKLGLPLRKSEKKGLFGRLFAREKEMPSESIAAAARTLVHDEPETTRVSDSPVESREPAPDIATTVQSKLAPPMEVEFKPAEESKAEAQSKPVVSSGVSELDAVPKEHDLVAWVQAPPALKQIAETQAGSEHAAAPKAEPSPGLAASIGGAEKGPSEFRAQDLPRPGPVLFVPESIPGTTSVRRRIRRVGEVPIYEEENFQAELRRELAKCKRIDRPLTLILIRVEDLEQILELFGKRFREPVLWHVAEQAMASLREVDRVGMILSKGLIAMTAFASDRYGGGRIVSRMRRDLGKHPFRVGEELRSIFPSLGFGMASYPEDADGEKELMSRADADMSPVERS